MNKSDSDLIVDCLGGDRQAFGQIVERYQRLLCSLAYSATGNLRDSEDIAQETFVEAWRSLPSLQEAEKLRPWLCGILRHKVGRLRRGNARQASERAEPLEAIDDAPSQVSSAAHMAIRKEEQEVLWGQLAEVPELYREPLILFYREERSVQHVAQALDLTEEAVKQRLARGRKLLQQRVLRVMESTLVRSAPGKAFTLSVLAALPALIPSQAKAATAGAAAAQGGALAKSTLFAGFLATCSGLVSALLGLRASLDQARTPEERRVVVLNTSLCVLGSFFALLVLWGLRQLAYGWPQHREALAWVSQFVVLGFLIIWPIGIVRMLSRARRHRALQRRAQPEYFLAPRDQVRSASSEYRSAAKLFGVPLVHFRFAAAEAGDRPVFGWIAGGDRAFGLLFAWGGWAVAPVSVGLCSVGLLSVGVMGVGVLGLGTFAVGGISLGCVAVGVDTYGWLSAFGWSTAQSGGFAIAQLAARGPLAFAQHANTAIAHQLLSTPSAERNQSLYLLLAALLPLVPAAYYMRAVRRRMGGRTSA